MTREEELFKRHLLDLADTAWHRNTVTFSDFMNLNEQNIYHNSQKEFSGVRTKAFGGYEYAARQMIAFIPDALSSGMEDSFYSGGWVQDRDEPDFPIACLNIYPLNVRFCEPLGHRDYLGSLMNLGIDRSKTGDIVIQEQEAYLFCHKKIAEYLAKELTRIRHTTVGCQLCSCGSIQYEPKLQEITGTVASIRLDALMSLAFNASRSSLTGMIEGGKTFVNGRLTTSNGYHPKDGDIISVRGYGRFRYSGILGNTKKGRCLVSIQKYI